MFSRLPARIAERMRKDVPAGTTDIDLSRWLFATFPEATPQDIGRAVAILKEIAALELIDEQVEAEWFWEHVF